MSRVESCHVVTENPYEGLLVIHAWNSQCGSCRYGGGSWADSPAREGKPVLVPESRECPNCRVRFSGTYNVYTASK